MAYTKIRPRRATAAEWNYANPILSEGEMVIEVPDTGVGTGYVNIKFGDGVTDWINLPYGIKSGYTGGGGGGDYDQDIANLNIRITALEDFLTDVKPRLVVLEAPITPASLDEGIEPAADIDTSEVDATVQEQLDNLDTRVTALETEFNNIKDILLIIDEES